MDDASLGVFVEEMNSVHIKSNLDLVTCSCSASGGYTSDHVLLLEADVQIDLSTHKLGNFNISGYNAVGHSVDELLLIVDTLRTDTCDNILADVILNHRIICLVSGKLQICVTDNETDIVALLLKSTVEEVHLRSSDKSCNEEVYRLVVEVLRSINLLNETVLHNYDTGRHCHSLYLVVSYVYEGGTDSLVDLGKLCSHGSTKLSIEV